MGVYVNGVKIAGRGRDGVNGQDGKDGIDGKSAYELAVDSGFVGSEADWLSSLEGPPGKDGEGIPSGGSDGQVLTKEDGSAVWADLPDGGGITQDDVDLSISDALAPIQEELGNKLNAEDALTISEVEQSISESLEPLQEEISGKQDSATAVTMEQVNGAIDTAIQEAVLDSWGKSY